MVCYIAFCYCATFVAVFYDIVLLFFWQHKAVFPFMSFSSTVCLKVKVGMVYESESESGQSIHLLTLPPFFFPASGCNFSCCGTMFPVSIHFGYFLLLIRLSDIDSHYALQTNPLWDGRGGI